MRCRRARHDLHMGTRWVYVQSVGQRQGHRQEDRGCGPPLSRSWVPASPGGVTAWP